MKKLALCLAIAMALTLVLPFWVSWPMCGLLGWVIGAWPAGVTLGPLTLMKQQSVDHVTVAAWRLAGPMLPGQRHWYVGVYAVGDGDRSQASWWPRLAYETSRLHGTSIVGRGWYLFTALFDLQLGYARNTGATVEL